MYLNKIIRSGALPDVEIIATGINGERIALRLEQIELMSRVVWRKVLIDNFCHGETNKISSEILSFVKMLRSSNLKQPHLLNILWLAIESFCIIFNEFCIYGASKLWL